MSIHILFSSDLLIGVNSSELSLITYSAEYYRLIRSNTLCFRGFFLPKYYKNGLSRNMLNIHSINFRRLITLRKVRKKLFIQFNWLPCEIIRNKKWKILNQLESSFWISITTIYHPFPENAKYFFELLLYNRPFNKDYWKTLDSCLYLNRI